MSAQTDSRNSKIVRNPRPVEEVVQSRLDFTQEQRDHLNMVKAKHNIVKQLVIRLAQSENEDEINATIHACKALNKEFFKAHLEEVHFELLIRNAELTARRLIAEGMSIPDPTYKSVVMVNVVFPNTPKEEVIGSTYISTWGKMAEAFSSGYTIR